MLHTLGTLQFHAWHVGKSGWEGDLRITKWGCVILCRNNLQTTSWAKNTPVLSRTQHHPGVWFPALKPHTFHWFQKAGWNLELGWGGAMEKK